MKYREALNIGSKAEGAIRCSYATIYDKDQKPLFSLRKETAVKMIDEYGEGELTIIEKKPGFYIYDDAHYNGAQNTFNVVGELPIVSVNQVSDERLVPAKVLPDAAYLIEDFIKEQARVIKYSVYRVYDVGTKAGQRKLMLETYKEPDSNKWKEQDTDKYHHEITEKYVQQKRWERLYEVLTNGEQVYIKPAAFNWNATDIYNATITDEKGKTITLLDYVSEAKEQLDKAKAVLLVAGAATII